MSKRFGANCEKRLSSQRIERTLMPAPKTKRIAPGAYDALVDALATIFWNKPPFERFLRIALRDHPELLSGLAFSGLKRAVASDLAMRLAANEDRYQEVTLALMLEVASTEDFSNLKQQTDGVQLLAAAQDAVAKLRTWTSKYGELAEAHERLRAERDAEHAQSEQRRSVDQVLEGLKESFLAMDGGTNPQQRGRSFETILNELFNLYDLNPRKSFTLSDEQVDGAFTFNTDDYLLEAKWEKVVASREDVDVLAQKVQRKGKNALGLFLAVAGFSEPAIRSHSNCGTGLIFMDGADLFSVLGGLISLTDVLDAKRRHVNETGLPLLLVRDILK
jgi:hypothetical protein